MIKPTHSMAAASLLLFLGSSAIAGLPAPQQAQRGGLANLPSQVRVARYRAPGAVLGLGTESIGADVIYNNTTSTALYVPLLPYETLWDSGYLPSPTFPFVAVFNAGCATSYTVTGIEFGYVTDQPTADIELSFAHQYDTCHLDAPPATAVLTLNGMPGSQNGSLAGWIMTIDLRNTPGLAPFDLYADGDGAFNPPNFTGDLFGFGFRITNGSPAGRSGPIAAGGEFGPYAGGIRWTLNGVDYSQAAGGAGQYGTMTHFPGNFCNDYYPYAYGPHLRLFADACGALAGETLCIGDGSGTACPCGNSSPSANREGCRSSVNGVNGARLEGLGTPRISQDTFFLRAHRLPPTTTALFFQGTSVVGGGAGVAFGDGLRCVGGTVTRLATRTASNSQVEYPVSPETAISILGGVATPGSRFYQVWYRNSAAFCTPATFNLSNGSRVEWTL